MSHIEKNNASDGKRQKRSREDLEDELKESKLTIFALKVDLSELNKRLGLRDQNLKTSREYLRVSKESLADEKSHNYDQMRRIAKLEEDLRNLERLQRYSEENGSSPSYTLQFNIGENVPDYEFIVTPPSPEKAEMVVSVKKVQMAPKKLFEDGE